MPSTFRAAVRFKDGTRGMFEITTADIDAARKAVLEQLEEAAVVLICEETVYKEKKND